ncbi:MAG: MotA/TolQ/ExbB proton channel family protein [Planctomycetaceae bacterium]|nr:MotA/TolQ/ExbB proton channel family protein [Planctomycetaceae bacterium]
MANTRKRNGNTLVPVLAISVLIVLFGIVVWKYGNAYVSSFSWFDSFIWLCGVCCLGFHCCFIVGKQRPPQKEYAQQLLLGFCEFFPLLGLTGTVIALLTTLQSPEIADAVRTQQIGPVIQKFAPALTTTVSGLLTMIINLLANFKLHHTIHQ